MTLIRRKLRCDLNSTAASLLKKEGSVKQKSCQRDDETKTNRAGSEVEAGAGMNLLQLFLTFGFAERQR
jgi:hypothetical protein